MMAVKQSQLLFSVIALEYRAATLKGNSTNLCVYVKKSEKAFAAPQEAACYLITYLLLHYGQRRQQGFEKVHWSNIGLL